MQEGIVKDQRTARVWNHMNRGDWFYPIRTWPVWAQKLMLLEHRNNRDRYSLFFFLTSNGLSPDIAGQWVLLRDIAAQGREVLGQYDEAARRQVIQMKEQIRKKEFFKGTKPVWDMHMGRVVNK